jgi:DnaJ-class molecular chaperone
MSIDYLPAPKINNCTTCSGTGTQGWVSPEGDYDVTTCDTCEGKPNKWIIRAVFYDSQESKVTKYTYYDEVTYTTIEECMEDINGERGDLLAQASTIDTETDDELAGFYLDDLEPYLIGDDNEN